MTAKGANRYPSFTLWNRLSDGRYTLCIVTYLQLEWPNMIVLSDKELPFSKQPSSQPIDDLLLLMIDSWIRLVLLLLYFSLMKYNFPSSHPLKRLVVTVQSANLFSSCKSMHSPLE